MSRRNLPARLWSSFSVRLLLSHVCIIAISLLFVLLPLQAIVSERMGNLAIIANRNYAYALLPVLEQHYAEQGGWQQLEALLPLATATPPDLLADLPPAYGWQLDYREGLPPPRMIITDSQHRVLLDNYNRFAIGSPLPAEQRLFDVPVDIAGANAGYVQLIRTFADNGLEEQALLSGFRRALGVVGGVATLLTLILSLLFARYLARPLIALSSQSLKVAAGKPHTPLPSTGMAVIDDMTRSFTHMADSLARQRELREQMISDIAHELRTPISILRLELEASQDGLLPAEQAVRNARAELDVLEHLITDLRLLAEADAGELKLQLVDLDLNQLAREGVQRWSTTAAIQQQQLILQLQPLPMVRADRFRIQQAIDNYISNACKYSRANSEIVVFTCREENGVKLGVQDNGHGIATEAQARVFERFFREDASRNRATGGNGLGLAITRKIIELHGGQVSVTSEKGKGSTFTLWLPVPPAQ